MSYQRGISDFEIRDVSLFDRVKAVRIKTWRTAESGGSLAMMMREAVEQKIAQPDFAAEAFNQLPALSQIWIDRPNNESLERLLKAIDGKGVTFFHGNRHFDFCSATTSITHFSDLEFLALERADHIPAEFVASFPKLEQLMLRRCTFEDDAIDEILALEHLSQLTVTKATLTPSQLRKLDDRSAGAGRNSKELSVYYY